MEYFYSLTYLTSSAFPPRSFLFSLGFLTFDLSLLGLCVMLFYHNVTHDHYFIMSEEVHQTGWFKWVAYFEVNLPSYSFTSQLLLDGNTVVTKTT